MKAVVCSFAASTLIVVTLLRVSIAAEPEDGLRLARQWCVSCHIVEPGAGGSDAARPFESVANDPYFTEDGLRAWLANPHPPMPNFDLTRVEVEALVTYIGSLRKE